MLQYNAREGERKINQTNNNNIPPITKKKKKKLNRQTLIISIKSQKY